jgi:hypothetical protein
MSKKVFPNSNLTNELANSAFFAKNPDKKDINSDVTTSTTDVKVIPISTLQESLVNTDSRGLNRKNLHSISLAILNASTNTQNTPVRLTDTEKEDLEDFILNKLRSKGVKSHKLSINKLMRICTRYMLKVHEEELLEIIIKAIKSKDDLSF